MVTSPLAFTVEGGELKPTISRQSLTNDSLLPQIPSPQTLLLTQLPLLQVSEAEQTLPQLPQLLRSVCRLNPSSTLPSQSLSLVSQTSEGAVGQLTAHRLYVP